MYPELVQDPAVHITPYTYYLVCVSTGYFIYDAFDICWNRRFAKEVEVMLHHFAVVSAFMHNVLTMKCIGYSVIALLVEVNTIFLHLRKLMQLNKVSFTGSPNPSCMDYLGHLFRARENNQNVLLHLMFEDFLRHVTVKRRPSNLEKLNSDSLSLMD
ncbi:TLC domain-containing protein 2 [Sparganum proliferum]